MPPQYSKPAVYLPYDVLYTICEPLTQSDRLNFLRVCRDWYLTGRVLLFSCLDFKLPIMGEPPKYNYSRRWNSHESVNILPKALHIADPVHKIYGRIDKICDSVARINCDLPAVFPVPTNLLANVRSARIHSQRVNVCGRNYHARGMEHAWAYDLMPYLLLHCPMLSDMEVEIESVWYPYRTIQRQRSLCLPEERSVNPFALQNCGIIANTGARWARDVMSIGERLRSFCMDRQSNPQLQSRLSRFSVTYTGHGYSPMAYPFTFVWYILHAMGVLETIENIEVKNLHTFDAGRFLSSYWFRAPLWRYKPILSDFRLNRVKSLTLECGEDQIESLRATLETLKQEFPSLESLSITKVGLFHGEELGFLDHLKLLKRLTITEKSSPELDAEEGPDAMRATNLLIECMELLLRPPNLRTIDWNRGGYQRARCHISPGCKPGHIEFVDVWLTVDGEDVFVGERYDGWYFREELYHGTGCEAGWGYWWETRFLLDSETGFYGAKEATPEEIQYFLDKFSADPDWYSLSQYETVMEDA